MRVLTSDRLSQFLLTFFPHKNEQDLWNDCYNFGDVNITWEDRNYMDLGNIIEKMKRTQHYKPFKDYVKYFTHYVNGRGDLISIPK